MYDKYNNLIIGLELWIYELEKNKDIINNLKERELFKLKELINYITTFVEDANETDI
jgi:predicted transcriptional regulator YheO